MHLTGIYVHLKKEQHTVYLMVSFPSFAYDQINFQKNQVKLMRFSCRVSKNSNLRISVSRGGKKVKYYSHKYVLEQGQNSTRLGSQAVSLSGIEPGSY